MFWDLDNLAATRVVNAVTLAASRTADRSSTRMPLLLYYWLLPHVLSFRNGLSASLARPEITIVREESTNTMLVTVLRRSLHLRP